MMQKCDIEMFDGIPPYKLFKSEGMPKSMPIAFEIFHEFANDSSYCSVGKVRKNETHCIFHYTVKGQGQVTYKGKQYKTSAGQGFFNIINEDGSGYGYPKDANGSWEFVVICFDGGNTRQIVSELLDAGVVYSIKEQEGRFAKMCASLCKGDIASITFLPELIKLISENSKQKSKTVSDFDIILERELLKNPTVSTIAAEMNVSREHLTRSYTELSGISPARQIKRKRFEMLCALLTSDMPLEAVAKKMSFPSVSGMGVFFKSISGITVTEYRKNGYLSI